MNSVRSQRILIALLILVTLLSGCQGFTRRLNPPTPQSKVPKTSSTTPEVEFTLAPPPLSDLGAIPEPDLLKFAWFDRSPFETGLVAGQKSVLNERFDRSVYHLRANIADDYQSMTLKEEVLYTNHEDMALDKIIMRMYPALFGAKVTFTGFRINGIEAQPVIRANDSVIEFPLKTGLKVGKSMVISIDLEMQMPSDPSGNYQVFGYVDHLLTLAHFYPIIAVFDTNGWHDEIPPSYGDVIFADTSYYLVDVTLPQDAVLVSSGIVKDKQTINNRQSILLAGGPMRDFYMAAGPGLEKISRQVGETTVNSYANSNVQDGSEKALDTAAEAINIYNRIIGPYPYTEFDILATSTTALGVEYPGMTVINRTVYLPDDPSQAIPNSVYLEATVAHETGHQWFYSTVGNDQVNQPWLDESLTQYITGMYYTQRYGRQASSDYQTSWYTKWDRVKAQDIPIGMPVSSYDAQTYNAIVYGRGPFFFTALDNKLGEAKFKIFLENYYQQNMWEISTPDKLKEIGETVCSCDLKGLFDDWVNPK